MLSWHAYACFTSLIHRQKMYKTNMSENCCIWHTLNVNPSIALYTKKKSNINFCNIKNVVLPIILKTPIPVGISMEPQHMQTFGVDRGDKWSVYVTTKIILWVPCLSPSDKPWLSVANHCILYCSDYLKWQPWTQRNGSCGSNSSGCIVNVNEFSNKLELLKNSNMISFVLISWVTSCWLIFITFFFTFFAKKTLSTSQGPIESVFVCWNKKS